MNKTRNKSETAEVSGKEISINTTDRLMDLPESVIGHIVSFLCPNDIIRLTSLSRNFRTICLTNPVLDFEATCPVKGKCLCTEISYSINNILVRRNGETLERLRIHLYNGHPPCEYDDGVGTLLQLWIRYAVECRVQELDIAWSVRKNLRFPRLDYVEVLKLNLSGSSFLLPPRGFPSLVSLTLSNVNIPQCHIGRTFGQWFTGICMNLKRLCLHNVSFNEISISSSSLEQLTVSGLGTHDTLRYYYNLNLDSPSIKDILILDCNFKNPTSWNIYCSSLRTLTVSGCQFPGHEMSEFVVSAERLEVLRLDLACQLEPFKSYYIPRLSFTEELLLLKDAFVRLQALDASGCLIRNHDLALVIEDRSEPGIISSSGILDDWSYSTSQIYLLPVLFGYGRKLANFCNLQHLVVTVGRFGGDEDVAISPFLPELVNLHTLTLKLDEDSVAVADSNLVYNMFLRATNYVTNNGAAKKVVFSFEDNVLKIDLDDDNSELLEELLKHDCLLHSVTLFFGEEEFSLPSINQNKPTERRSTSDYGVCMDSSSIAWLVKKQPTITTAELFWLRTLFQDPANPYFMLEPRSRRSPNAAVQGLYGADGWEMAPVFAADGWEMAPVFAEDEWV